MKLQSRIKLVLFIVLLLISLLVIGSKNNAVIKEKRISEVKSNEKLVRLHVVAHSNSLHDQHIKREIRDLVLVQIKQLLLSASSRIQPVNLIKRNKAELRTAIQNKLNFLGVDYGVQLNLGKFNFPTRSYGDISLPAGQYRALRVVLGAGQGENWWCVLFPPLCFVDSRDQVSRKKLKNLSSRPKKKKLSVEFKFKCREVLENNPRLVKSKLKWIKILKTSFPGMEQFISPGSQQESVK